MSLITPEQFRSSWTQAQVDQYVNEMAVSPLQFALVSSLFHRFYGVLNGSADGERLSVQDPSDPDRSDTPDRFILNACARYAYPRIADTVVSELEQEIGYNLTTRYITEEIPFLTSHNKFMTKFPGVAALNVRRSWVALEGYEQIDVSPYIEENLVAVYPWAPGDSITPAVLVSAALSPNPNEVILRDSATESPYPWFTDDGHRLRRTISNEWQLPMAVNRKSYTPDAPINVQHKKLVYVDIVPPTLPTGAVLYPVYEGTNQIIPEARARETVTVDGDTYWRYWFYVYTLVHNDFVAETVDLQVGEFYKLVPYIGFRYSLDVTAAPSIVITQGTRETVLTPTLTLVNHEYGIFHVNWDSCAADYESCCLQSYPDTVNLRYSYKTDPTLLPEKYYKQIGRLIEAACGRIAAQMPTHECGCPVPWGYIMDKQKMYKDTVYNTLTGETQDKMRYGRLMGQLEYAAAVNLCFKYSRPLNLHQKS